MKVIVTIPEIMTVLLSKPKANAIKKRFGEFA